MKIARLAESAISEANKAKCLSDLAVEPRHYGLPGTGLRSPSKRDVRITDATVLVHSMVARTL